VAYKLALPPQWTIHPIFHASILTPYIETKEHGENYSRPPLDLIEGKEQYEVETIRSNQRHGKRKQLQYLIKWKGYPESDNTWKPVTNLQAPHLIKEYHKRHPLNSINRSELQAEGGHPPNWLLHTEHAPPTYSMTRPLGTNSPLLLGTSMPTTPHSLLLPPPTESAADIASAKPNPSNTSTPTQPSATTPAASTTAKCLKCSTPPATLPLLDQPQCPPVLRTQLRPIAPWTRSPPLPNRSMPDNSQRTRYSTSHTPPHPPSKKYRCPRFEYASTRHRRASPMPPCPLAQPKPSFASAGTNSAKLHERWPTDLQPQWNNAPPLPPNNSPPPAPVSTTS
jgi:hypothetical protein